MLTLGAVHTGLVQHSGALPVGRAAELLDLVEGATVVSVRRPMACTTSPEVLTGVDCDAPSGTGRRVRLVGTVIGRASLTGGRVAQSSVDSRLQRAATSTRLPWHNYLGRPGQLDAIGKVSAPAVVDGYLRGDAGRFEVPHTSLDLDAVAMQLLDRVQRGDLLDRRPPLRAPRTTLRWSITVDDRSSVDARATFTVGAGQARTLEVTLGRHDPAAARLLCEDLALHDWLVTTVSSVVDDLAATSWPPPVRVRRLSLLVEHLTRLWMPGARVPGSMSALTQELDRQAGLTRQWTACVQWIRDQLAAAAAVQSLTKM
ncbi:SCO2521 family protein [Micromonospora sp. NPDC048842]|uniref:SCO2521 family protein n=1 Tax=unclassified Micromonospora TaxID=2617518 RepID=UPI0034103750